MSSRQKQGEPVSPHGIRDNHEYGKVADFLKDKIANGSDLSIVSAYFTIYAYDALAEELGRVESLRFLFGEPRFIASLDPDKTDKKSFKIEDEGLELKNRLQQKEVARRCAQWIKDKVEIRSIRQANLLHGKLYHVQDGGREHAILGSSNFTRRGLGLSSQPNIELNLIVDSDRDRAELKKWFDRLWEDENQVEDVKGEVLNYLEQIYADHAPEFIYFKTLYHVFERFLSDQDADAALLDQTNIIETQIWKALFEFQKDGVKGAIHKINTHDGCILADSVGLGKTYIALAVIKYFELRNHRVLVLCPKRLRDNWTVYQAHNNSRLNPFPEDRLSFTVLSHTDLSRQSGKVNDIDLATLNWGNYDLVVIDESHNFRNNTKGRRDEEGNVIRKSRYERLMEDIVQSGVNTKVLLLSATPVNNDLADLHNQIHFITEKRDDKFSGFGINSIKGMLGHAQKIFKEWARQNQRDSDELMDQLPSGFFTLLDELTLARSRKHIQRHYKESLDEIGEFPERLKPESVYQEIDLKGDFPSYDDLNDEIADYQLSLYKPSFYVLPQFEQQYKFEEIANFSQSKREHFLIGMMRVNFLKRLESSVHAFYITMRRTIDRIEDLEQRLQDFKAKSALDADKELEEMSIDQNEEDEELAEAFQVGTKRTFSMEHLDVDAWLQDLADDKAQLSKLAYAAKSVDATRDAKLDKLKELIANKANEPTTNNRGELNRKVIVFSAFADTANYLYDNLNAWARDELDVHIALVVGGNKPNRTTFGSSDYTEILTNFAPRAKQRDKRHQDSANEEEAAEIDILIATDCISEGQDLQDCDYLINYDIHWNPVRIIQRFGRIDRIGSLNKEIQLVNFWPTEDLNKYINLKNRVEARMALVDIAATAEDNILQIDNLEEVIENDLHYRDQQLLRLKDEVLDLEDFSETISLSEFTLDEFRRDLANYIEANRDQLEAAPLGLYAVVPPHPESKIIQPGTIFCLRQNMEAADNEKINPLQPYFLVYIYDSGEACYNFTAPKQILEIFRALCRGQTQAYTELCRLFNNETDNGNNMKYHSQLLDKAVDAIVKKFSSRNIGNLFDGRAGKIANENEQVKHTEDFELITWLVIKEESNA